MSGFSHAGETSAVFVISVEATKYPSNEYPASKGNVTSERVHFKQIGLSD